MNCYIRQSHSVPLSIVINCMWVVMKSTCLMTALDLIGPLQQLQSNASLHFYHHQLLYKSWMTAMASIRTSALLELPVGLRTALLTRTLPLTSTHTRTAPSRTHISSTARRFTQESTSAQSSVNETEVSHFNALASSWWDPHGSSRLLHLMNPLRHKFIRQCLGDVTLETHKTLKYLDVGSGGGIFAESAARLSNTASVTAIDPTPEVIAIAKRHQRQDPLLLEPGRLTYENTTIETLPLPPSPQEGYDIVTLFEVVEHIQKPSPFMQSCLAHLKPGGWLVGSTIARTNVSWFTTKFMAEEVLGMVPRGTHEWSQYVQPNELWQWARVQPELDTEGLDGWRVMGVMYVPGIGWREVGGSESWGNYFFGVRKRGVEG